MRSLLQSIVTVAIVSIVFMGLMYLLKIGINNINEFDLNEKIESFQNGKTFICSTGLMGNQKILVNKSGSWEIHKMRYFKKEETLQEIRLCQEEE